VQRLTAHEEAVTKDWRSRSERIRRKKQKAAELRKQRREYEEEKMAALMIVPRSDAFTNFGRCGSLRSAKYFALCKARERRVELLPI